MPPLSVRIHLPATPARSVTTLPTLRKLVLDRLYRECTDRGLVFFMSDHFRERINVRSHDQDVTFKGLLRAALFILSRYEEFEGQVISIQISAHYFGLKISEGKLVCLTYFFNNTRDGPAKLSADRKFTLKEQRETP